jgi:hypothetical protein
MRGGVVPQSPQAAMANRPKPEDAANHITVGLKNLIMKSICGSSKKRWILNMLLTLSFFHV